MAKLGFSTKFLVYNSAMNPMRLRKEVIVDYCRHFVSLLVQNIDIFVALCRDRIDDDLEGIYKDYDTSVLISEKQRQIILDVLTEKSKTKQEYLNAIYTILDDPVLFEAMIMCYDEPVESLFEALETFDRIDALKIFRDKVFLARFKYIQTLVQLYQKAAHLFGFISLEEVDELIRVYEKLNPFSEEKYQRKRGRYKKTLFADPAYRCMPIMYKHLQAGISMVLFTLDGLLVSPIFMEEYEKEAKLILKEESGIFGEWTQETFDAFFEKLDGVISYRKAYISVINLPLNIVGYTTSDDDFTVGDSKNVDELKRYLIATFLERMTKVDDEDFCRFLLNGYGDQMCELISDHNTDLERNLDRGIEFFKAATEDFGIKVTKDEILQVTMLLSLVAGDQRNWLTRGFSDNELQDLAEDIESDMFLERFGIGGAEAEEVEEIDPDSGERIYRIHRDR